MKFLNRQTVVAALLAGTGLALTLPAVAQTAMPGAGQGGQGQGLQTAPGQTGARDGTGPMAQRDGTGPAAQSNDAAPMGAGPMAGGDRLRGGFDIAQFDSNGDGKVTLEEIQAKRAADAKALDANGDGSISQDELVNFELAKVKARIEARVKARFEAQDSNGDGQLSAAELLAHPLPTRMFSRIDRNGDGAVDAQEMQSARQFMRERMGEGRHHDRAGKGDRDGRHRMDRFGARDGYGRMMPGGQGPMDGSRMGPGTGPRGQWGNGAN